MVLADFRLFRIFRRSVTFSALSLTKHDQAEAKLIDLNSA
jgi:hypothetical protein